MPPGKHFGPAQATSIDLDTHDLVAFSRHRRITQIVADRVHAPFDGFDIIYPRKSRLGARPSFVRSVEQIAAASRPDVIIVQQRLPLAAQIARAVPDSRVILRTHNLQKTFCDRSAITRKIKRAHRQRQYEKLHGIIHVSQSCADAFADTWPEVTLPSCVINNGLDFARWQPARERTKEILCVARCVPEKGVLEAAQSMMSVLKTFSRWRARFILSKVDRQPQYYAEILNVLSGLGDQVSVETDQPHANVKRACERAAIALVPSKWTEPFGRTAFEAHAGGAALISSGRGGLAEISGEAAFVLSDISAEFVRASLVALLTDQPRREHLAQAGAERVRRLFDIRSQSKRLDRFVEAIANRELTNGFEASGPRRAALA
jgi:glycosyltransferase involved in cell wall biosynthesis